MKNIYINLRYIFLMLFVLSGINDLKAATFNSVSTGDWIIDANWDSAPSTNNCSSAGNNTFNVYHAITSTCNPLNFSGNVTIHIFNGGSFTINGGGGITGSVTLIVDAGGAVTVTGNLNLSGSSVVNINGSLTVGGNVIGAGSTFDCNGSNGTGTVAISGSGCANCTGGSNAGCSIALPVDYLTFTANYSSSNENTVTLLWETTKEVNNNYFYIEKSFDGLAFENIAQIFSNSNNSSTVNNYRYDDNIITPSNTLYYRLKQVDNNGDYTLSNIITVKTEKTSSFDFRIFPNPTQGDNVNLLYSGVSKEVLLVVYDVTGQQMFSKTFTFETDNILTAKDFGSNLSTGIYYIQASSDGSMIKRKLIIQ